MMTRCRAPPTSRLNRPQAGTDGSTRVDDARPPGSPTGPRGAPQRV